MNTTADTDRIHEPESQIAAPFPEAAADQTALARAFELLTRLHRKRRTAAPSDVITQLFQRTRALPAFRARPGGAQLDAYGTALARLVGVEVKPAVLPLRSGDLVPIPPSAKEGAQ